MRRPIGAEPPSPLVLIVEDANFNVHAERITLESRPCSRKKRASGPAWPCVAMTRAAPVAVMVSSSTLAPFAMSSGEVYSFGA